MIHLPKDFTRRIRGAFGPAGAEWLDDLPALLEQLQTRWQLELGAPFIDMAYNYVAPGTLRDGAKVVLKAGIPNRELYTEIAALKVFDGSGCVRLLDADPGLGALLLERLEPGEPLFNLEDDEDATGIAAQVMGALWKPVPERHDFPSIADWGRGFERLRDTFDGGAGPFPEQLVRHAEALFSELLGSMERSVLLHGDLHHWNILSSAGSTVSPVQNQTWLAIDPKGVIGEPEYEAGAWLRNPYPQLLAWPDPQGVTRRRIDQFASLLDLDKDRITAWGYAQAVLSAWWGYEDQAEDWGDWLAVVDLFPIDF